MISLGRLLGVRVIAEGIETAAPARLLERMGCEERQGYHFGPPMPAAEFADRFLTKSAMHSDSAAMAQAAATAA